MSDTLAQLITRIQAQLIDDGTLFSTATCTAAVRQTLLRFNVAAPVQAGTLVDVVKDQRDYQLAEADFAGLLDLLDVLEFFEVVAPGHVFVLGDNRDRSADSRGDGGWQVPLGRVRGRAAVVWWSWGRGGRFLFGQSGLRPERLFKRIE